MKNKSDIEHTLDKATQDELNLLDYDEICDTFLTAQDTRTDFEKQSDQIMQEWLRNNIPVS